MRLPIFQRRGDGLLLVAHASFLLKDSRIPFGSRWGSSYDTNTMLTIQKLSTRRALTTTPAFDGNPSSSKFVKSYTLKGIGRGARVDVTTITGHHLATTDVPLSMGGEDSAPQPMETLLAAWMGCTQATAVFVGRQMKPTRLLIDRLEFDTIQAFRDERGALQLPIEIVPKVPSRLQRITGTIRVFPKKQAKSNRSSALTNKDIQQLQEQTEARCPVANMIIASGCCMDVNWTIGMEEE
jgi:putative redox protein